MTHTLHRFRINNEKASDYVFLCMAAQKYNSAGSVPKLQEMYNILRSEEPDNYGDDNFGGIYTGQFPEDILPKMKETSYPGAAFSDIEKVKRVLKKFKEADTGICVVLTGDFDDVHKALAEVGLKPHTVNISLGIFGNTARLPADSVLEISTMCGHGMVCPDHIEYVMRRVEKGFMTPEEGAAELARPCTCAIFNPKRAADILERECCHKEGK